MTGARTRRGQAPLLTCVLTCLAPLSSAAAPGDASTSATDEDSSQGLVRIRVKPKSRKVVARLRAELQIMGYEVEILELSSRAPTLGPELFDHLDGASAAIEIEIEGERLDVWVADQSTGKISIRRFDLRSEPERAEPRTLAIAAVELLRASQLEGRVLDEHDELEPIEQQTEGERPPEDEAPPPYEFPFRGALSLAPMLGASAGGPGLTTHIEIAGRWTPKPRFGLRFSAWVPNFGNRVGNDTQGSARVFLAMAFIEPQLLLPGGVRWFHPELGLGLGAALTTISGDANDGFRSAAQVLGGFAGHAHLGLGFELSPRIWLRLDGYVGIIQPQPRVVFVEDVVARMGLPFGSGSIGIEVWF